MDHGGFWSCRTRSDASTGSVGCDGSDSANLRRRGHIASKGHGWLRYCSMIEAKEHETCGSLAHARHGGRFNAGEAVIGHMKTDGQRVRPQLRPRRLVECFGQSNETGGATYSHG